MPNSLHSNEMQFYCGMQHSLHAVNVPKDRAPSSHDPRWEKRAVRESDWSALPLQGAPAETPVRPVLAALALLGAGLVAVARFGFKKPSR